MIKTISDDVGSIDLTYDTETHRIEGYVDEGIGKKITDKDFDTIMRALKIMYAVEIKT
jgi:hypothetical protein